MERAAARKIDRIAAAKRAGDDPREADVRAAEESSGLERAITAAAQGNQATWVRASLMSAGLSAQQIASVYNTPATAADAAAALAAQPSGEGPLLPVAPEGPSEAGQGPLVEPEAPFVQRPTIERFQPPAVAPDLAALGQGSVALDQHAHVALQEALAVADRARVKAEHSLRAHFTDARQVLDARHGAGRAAAEAAFVTSAAALTQHTARARAAIVAGEARAREQLAVHEARARGAAVTGFALYTTEYTKQGAAAKARADAELARYRQHAEAQRHADPQDSTFLRGDMRQHRFDARMEAAQAVHANVVGQIEKATHDEVAHLADPKDQRRQLVFGVAGNAQQPGVIGKTLESVRGPTGQPGQGQLGKLGVSLLTGCDTQTAQLHAQLERTKTDVLRHLDRAHLHGVARLRAARVEAIGAVRQAAGRNADALQASVESSLTEGQRGVQRGTQQAQQALGQIDRLLADPNIATSPVSGKLRQARLSLIMQSRHAGEQLGTHAAAVGSQLQAGGAQLAESLGAMSAQASAQLKTTLGGLTGAMDRASSQAVHQVQALTAQCAGQLGRVEAQAGEAFSELVGQVPVHLQALNKQIDETMLEQAVAFGDKLNKQVRSAEQGHQSEPLYKQMCSQGEMAAAAVQPRWKKWVKWVITAVVIIAVIAAAIFLGPIMIGLAALAVGEGVLATVIGGAIVGAATGAFSGLAIQLGHNAIDIAGEAAAKDEAGNDIKLSSNLGAATWAGAWTGALGGGLGAGVGHVLAHLPIWNFIAGQLVNVGVDGLAQILGGHYNTEAGLTNFLIGLSLSAAMSFVGARAGMRSAARGAGAHEPVAEPSLSPSISRPIGTVADFMTRLNAKGEQVGAALTERIRPTTLSEAPSPAAAHVAQPAAEAEPAAPASAGAEHADAAQAPHAPPAGAGSVSVPAKDGPSPREVVAAMTAEKRQRLDGITGRDPRWRELITKDTDFVRVINRREYEALFRDGRVVNPRTQAIIKKPIAFGEAQGAHQRMLEEVYNQGEGGRLTLREEMGTTSAGEAGPFLPISAIAPADSGYAEALLTDPDRFLVKFKPGIRKGTGNDSVGETEYLIPHWYKLEDVEWVASVHDNRWVYGEPGREGAAGEVASVRSTLPAEKPVVAAPPGRKAQLQQRLELVRGKARLLKAQLRELPRAEYLALQKKLTETLFKGSHLDVTSEFYYGDLDKAEARIVDTERAIDAARQEVRGAAPAEPLHEPAAVEAAERASPSVEPTPAPAPAPSAEEAQKALHTAPVRRSPLGGVGKKQGGAIDFSAFWGRKQSPVPAEKLATRQVEGVTYEDAARGSRRGSVEVIQGVDEASAVKIADALVEQSDLLHKLLGRDSHWGVEGRNRFSDEIGDEWAHGASVADAPKGAVRYDALGGESKAKADAQIAKLDRELEAISRASRALQDGDVPIAKREAQARDLLKAEGLSTDSTKFPLLKQLSASSAKYDNLELNPDRHGGLWFDDQGNLVAAPRLITVRTRASAAAAEARIAAASPAAVKPVEIKTASSVAGAGERFGEAQAAGTWHGAAQDPKTGRYFQEVEDWQGAGIEGAGDLAVKTERRTAALLTDFDELVEPGLQGKIDPHKAYFENGHFANEVAPDAVGVTIGELKGPALKRAQEGSQQLVDRLQKLERAANEIQRLEREGHQPWQIVEQAKEWGLGLEPTQLGKLKKMFPRSSEFEVNPDLRFYTRFDPSTGEISRVYHALIPRGRPAVVARPLNGLGKAQGGAISPSLLGVDAMARGAERLRAFFGRRGVGEQSGPAVSRSEAERNTAELAVHAQHALETPSFAARNNENTTAVAAESASAAAQSLHVHGAAAEHELSTAFEHAAQHESAEFAPAFSASGQKIAGREAAYTMAMKDAPRVALETLPEAMHALGPNAGRPMTAPERAALQAEANHVIQRATLADVAKIVERDLGLSVSISEEELLALIKSRTPPGDYFYGQLDSIPLRAHVGGQPLTDAEEQTVNAALRLANTTWAAGQVHRAAWEGATRRIDPKQGVYGSVDSVKFRMAGEGAQGGVADAVLLVVKDLLELQRALPPKVEGVVSPGEAGLAPEARRQQLAQQQLARREQVTLDSAESRELLLTQAKVNEYLGKGDYSDWRTRPETTKGRTAEVAVREQEWEGGKTYEQRFEMPTNPAANKAVRGVMRAMSDLGAQKAYLQRLLADAARLRKLDGISDTAALRDGLSATAALQKELVLRAQARGAKLGLTGNDELPAGVADPFFGQVSEARGAVIDKHPGLLREHGQFPHLLQTDFLHESLSTTDFDAFMEYVATPGGDLTWAWLLDDSFDRTPLSVRGLREMSLEGGPLPLEKHRSSEALARRRQRQPTTAGDRKEDRLAPDDKTPVRGIPLPPARPGIDDDLATEPAAASQTERSQASDDTEAASPAAGRRSRWARSGQDLSGTDLASVNAEWKVLTEVKEIDDARTVKLEFVAPNGKRGKLRAEYAPKDKLLELISIAFDEDVPHSIDTRGVGRMGTADYFAERAQMALGARLGVNVNKVRLFGIMHFADVLAHHNGVPIAGLPFVRAATKRWSKMGIEVRPVGISGSPLRMPFRAFLGWLESARGRSAEVSDAELLSRYPLVGNRDLDEEVEVGFDIDLEVLPKAPAG